MFTRYTYDTCAMSCFWNALMSVGEIKQVLAQYNTNTSKQNTIQLFQTALENVLQEQTQKQKQEQENQNTDMLQQLDGLHISQSDTNSTTTTGTPTTWVPSVLVNEEPITPQCWSELCTWIRSYNPNLYGQGHWSSTCDPFLVFVCFLTRSTIHVNYNGYPVVYKYCGHHLNENKFYFANNKSHFHRVK